MGSMNALGMNEAVVDGLIELRQALSWHLTSNHYPSVPLSMLDACVLAIEYMNEEDTDANITLPEGVLWRGQAVAPAWAIVDAYHLESFLEEN
jgi:hypothetical protein